MLHSEACAFSPSPYVQNDQLSSLAAGAERSASFPVRFRGSQIRRVNMPGHMPHRGPAARLLRARTCAEFRYHAATSGEGQARCEPRGILDRLSWRVNALRSFSLSASSAEARLLVATSTGQPLNVPAIFPSTVLSPLSPYGPRLLHPADFRSVRTGPFRGRWKSRALKKPF